MEKIQEGDIMTIAQEILMAVWFVASCIGLIWLLIDARQSKTESHPNSLKDQEQVLEMLARVGDQFSLSIYKKAYKMSNNDMMPP
jgi:hypothetical protein